MSLPQEKIHERRERNRQQQNRMLSFYEYLELIWSVKKHKLHFRNAVLDERKEHDSKDIEYGCLGVAHLPPIFAVVSLTETKMFIKGVRRKKSIKSCIEDKPRVQFACFVLLFNSSSWNRIIIAFFWGCSSTPPFIISLFLCRWPSSSMSRTKTCSRSFTQKCWRVASSTTNLSATTRRPQWSRSWRRLAASSTPASSSACSRMLATPKNWTRSSTNPVSDCRSTSASWCSAPIRGRSKPPPPSPFLRSWSGVTAHSWTFTEPATRAANWPGATSCPKARWSPTIRKVATRFR